MTATPTPAEARVAAAVTRLDALLVAAARDTELTVGTVDLEAVLDELDHLRRGDEQCCPEACNGGACESCRCCAAGWCVTGADGLPEVPDDLARWIEAAAEHNPIVAAWQADRAELDRLRSAAGEVRYLWTTDAMPDSARQGIRDHSVLLGRTLDELAR